MKKVITTFYADLPGWDTLPERKLLTLFVNEWEKNGWEVRILQPQHAMQHPLYEQFAKKISTFPTVNETPEATRDGTGYEAWCWKRHLAFGLETPGLVGDFDVFPTGAEFARDRNLTMDKMTCFQGLVGQFEATACPSLLWVNESGSKAFIDFILALPDGFSNDAVNGQPHFSDMAALRIFPTHGGVQLDKKVWQIFEDGWQSAPMVHMNRGGLHPKGLTPRYAHIPKLLQEARAK